MLIRTRGGHCPETQRNQGKVREKSGKVKRAEIVREKSGNLKKKTRKVMEFK